MTFTLYRQTGLPVLLPSVVDVHDGRQATFPTRLIDYTIVISASRAGLPGVLSLPPDDLIGDSKESGNDFILCKWFGVIAIGKTFWTDVESVQEVNCKTNPN